MKYNSDSTQYDSLFIGALTVYLAAKLATAIRQDEALGLQLMQEFRQVVLPEALTVDGNEEELRSSKPTDQSEWIASRRAVTAHPYRF